MLFFSYFKELVGKEVTVELKNDLAIRGTMPRSWGLLVLPWKSTTGSRDRIGYGIVLTRISRQAKEQVVAGKMYYLTLEANDCGSKKQYEAKVWVKPWMNFMELEDFKPLTDSPSTSSQDKKQLEQSSEGRRKKMLVLLQRTES
ncbi:hypothetical protein ZIOFF_001674 [Zingiber officinale]|uniref:Cysteine proteinase inhibitor n=1 Tax=Zingiber officinale TaxID=94328 RepID=A0A8J5I3Z0_ZINOF|nr:hypothetical protein ZIOFF_001674 [Zingiber officinale]